MDKIVIHGARQHNLKGIDLELPRNKLIVITGVSGSGKSSLAFDTLFAEGQRRYIEALSTHARQFLQRLDAPRVEEVLGLSPAIAIEQKGMPRNPRSTVGTLTEVHDYLRLLYTRLGTLYCPQCTLPVRAQTIPQMLAELLDDWPSGTRLLLLAPLGTVLEKDLAKTLKKLVRDGFARLRLDGSVYELDPIPRLPRRSSYRAEVVIDRLILDPAKSQRISDSLELAARWGNGAVLVVGLERGEKTFSESFRCVSCGRTYPAPSPALFSFHHPSGACSSCKGLGYALQPHEDARLTESHEVHTGDSGLREADAAEPEWAEEHPLCPSCGGTRLNELARSVRLGGMGIHEVSRLALPSLLHWLSTLPLSPTQAQIAERARQEIIQRIGTMEELGLSYLTLDRAALTLSGGEAQRIRLAQQIGTRLSGVLYILDEPSIGLHPHDHQRLLDILFRLRDAGNTVIVVEHDMETIAQSDYVVDMGPGAGALGGHVVFAGTPAQMATHGPSLTGDYLTGRKRIPIPAKRHPFSRGALRIVGAREHNLKNITVEIPLGCLSCITGVSGSGKSSLVLDTLYRALTRRSPGTSLDSIQGADQIAKVILVDQSPLGKTPRSTPATYMGLFSLIRQLYSQLPEARSRGYGPNRFSFNVKGGRCESCKGEGLQRIEMYFLPDVYVTCPACHGKRYGPDTLQILFKGRSIAEVLNLTVHEASGFFENLPSLRRKLLTLLEVGLGYLRLGQPATTLSGGEAQRVKLAAELARRASEHTLYILDEPTTGLHMEDIQKLLHVLQRLVDLGHTVIVIEHQIDVVKTADYVVDLGPRGGEEGGYLVAAGAPEEVAHAEESFTGQYIRRALSGDVALE